MNTPEQKQETDKNKPIVHLTKAAIEKVRSMQEKDDKKEHGLRVGVVTGGCSGLSYELRFQKSPYDNDIIFTQDGIKIIMNPESISFLYGTEVDYVDTLKESGFQYKNPNAKSSCGCGVSFS